MVLLTLMLNFMKISFLLLTYEFSFNITHTDFRNNTEDYAFYDIDYLQSKMFYQNRNCFAFYFTVCPKPIFGISHSSYGTFWVVVLYQISTIHSVIPVQSKPDSATVNNSKVYLCSYIVSDN